jgi:hypothetical protein
LRGYAAYKIEHSGRRRLGQGIQIDSRRGDADAAPCAIVSLDESEHGPATAGCRNDHIDINPVHAGTICRRRRVDSRLARFMSVDPNGGAVDDPQTLNRYVYVQNNPTNRTDPWGLWSSRDLSYPQVEANESSPYAKRACYLDGAETTCGRVLDLMVRGDAFGCPNSNCTGMRLQGDIWYKWS